MDKSTDRMVRQTTTKDMFSVAMHLANISGVRSVSSLSMEVENADPFVTV
jgi:hypothetical protein